MKELMSFWVPILAPYGAGSPPAMVMYFYLYKSILTASGNPDLWVLAAIIALVGVVAMVGTEAYTYKTAARAFAEGEISAFLIALAGALLCSGTVIYAVFSGVNPQALIASVIFSVVLYATLANNTYLSTRQAITIRDGEKDAQKNDKQLEFIKAQSDGEIEKLRTLAKTEEAKASGERAKARAAKASTGQITASTGQTGQNGQDGKPELDPLKLAWVRTFYADPNNSGKAAAAMVGVLGCPFTSRETARKYKAAL
jgi:low affinity Fe/Cu permease